MSEEEKQQRHLLQTVEDWLKRNSYRIATDSFTRTSTPLGSRADFKSLDKFVKGETPIDIVGLDPNRRIFFARVYYSDEILAHQIGDLEVINAIEAILTTEIQDAHFLFFTNGVITPNLAKLSTNPEGILEYFKGLELDVLSTKISKLSFLEMRYDPHKLKKMADKIYIRKIIRGMRILKGDYEGTEFKCSNCGGTYLKGSFTLSYDGRAKNFPYYVCKECYIESDDQNLVEEMDSFVAPLG